MHNRFQRVLAFILILSVISGLLLPSAPARAAETSVNVALLGTASTADGSYADHVIGNVIDGDLTTNWQTQGVWPSTAEVRLDMGRSA